MGGVNLYGDIRKRGKGEGFWGRLCEEALFPEFTKNRRYPGFFNYRAGQMGPDRFRPGPALVQWLQRDQTAGDYACCLANFGKYFAGHSVPAECWAVRHFDTEFDSTSAGSWNIGNYLVADPSFLTPDSLWLHASGDRYRFEGSAEFDGAPYFNRSANELRFGTHYVDGPCSNYGGVLLLR